MILNTNIADNEIKKKIIILILLFFSTAGYSQKIWTLGTADIISKNELNLNIIQNSSFGINNFLEIQSNPFYFYFLPNIGIKYRWHKKNAKLEKKLVRKIGFVISSKHNIYYPTKALDILKNNNFFDYSPIPNTIGNFLSFSNKLLFTFVLRKNKSCYIKNSYLTFKFGNIKSIKNKNYLYSVNKNALLYRLTAMFDDKSEWNIGVQFDNFIDYGLYYKINLNFYTKGFNLNNIIIDQQSIAYFYWGAKHRIRTGLGYIVTNSFSEINPSLIPIFTFGYRINIILGKHSKNLFRNGVMESPEDTRDMF